MRIPADRRNLILLAIGWIVAILLIDPRGEFPTTDDWAYAESVRAMIAHGRLHYSDWAAANLLTHFLWGSLFALPFGASYAVLRASTLAAAYLGAVAFYRLARLLPVEPAVALIAAAAWLFNPLCVALSFGFMSDIGFAALMLGSLLMLASGARRGAPWRSAAGWLLGIAALLSRQIAMGIPVGWAAGRFRSLEGDWRSRLLRLTMPLVGFAACQTAFQEWLVTSGLAPAFYSRQTSGILTRILHQPLASARLMAGMAPKCFLYFGILCLPLTLTLAPAAFAAATARRRLLLAGGAFAIFAAIAGALWWRGMLFPIWPNTLGYFGIGPDVHGVLTPQPVLILLTVTATAGGVLAAMLVLRALLAFVRDHQAPHGFDIVAAAAASGLAIVAALMIVALRFDRYLIAVLPFALLLAAAASNRPVSARAVRAGAIAAAAMALVSIAAMHDFLAAKRIQGAAFASLAAKAGPDHVDGGWVLNGPTWFRRYTDLPDREPDSFLRLDYVVEPGDAPRPGYRELARLPVPRWLPWGRNTVPILVERLIDPATRVVRPPILDGQR